MESSRFVREIATIILVTLILALSFNYPSRGLEYALYLCLSILAILLINIVAKKIFAYNLETIVNIKPWSVYQTGFRKNAHFQKPVPMLWLPILTSLVTKGLFVWFPLLEFDVASKPERVSRRHGLYRYTEVTEWHIALIAVSGIVANLFFAGIGYLAGWELFTKLSVYYAFWSIIPISSLDGSKIFFGSRVLWFAFAIITLILLLWGILIVI